MTNGKYLGKIQSIWYGVDSDNRFGLHFVFTGNWGNVDWFDGVTILNKWNDEVDKEHRAQLYRLNMNILSALQMAYKHKVEELAGTPVEVEFKDNLLDSWRILSEVL